MADEIGAGTNEIRRWLIGQELFGKQPDQNLGDGSGAGAGCSARLE